MTFKIVPSSQLADIYPEVEFGDHVAIGNDVKIGRGSKIAAGVQLYPGTVLGEKVTVLGNTVIGRPTVVPPSSTVKRIIAEGVPPTEIGDESVIGACVVLYRGSVLGKRNIICDLSSIRERCILGDDVLLGRSVMVQVNTRIGARTKIMDSCHLPGDMLVEEDVFLSTHVCGASENSIGRGDSTNQWSGPHIGKRAYVGVNATLLPGVRLGSDCVVGAGALVTKDVAERTLVMGVPAKPVRALEPRTN